MSTPRVLRVLGHVAGAGLAVVGFVLQPAAAIGGVMVAVFVAGGMALHLQEWPPADALTGRRAVVEAGGTALWVWLVGTGVVMLLGGSGQAVLVTLLLVGVPAAVHVRRRLRPPVAAVNPEVKLPAVVPLPVLGTLSTQELCLAWRRSYLTLVDLPAGPGRSELVAVRQSMLDELERRDSDGFHRWLEAGARAGGDPSQYLAAGPGG
jgi:hypothetical protein